MNEFIDEINSYVSSFKQQKITEEQLFVSFAIAIRIMRSYGLISKFNELSSYYKDNYIKTVDVDIVKD